MEEINFNALELVGYEEQLYDNSGVKSEDTVKNNVNNNNKGPEEGSVDNPNDNSVINLDNRERLDFQDNDVNNNKNESRTRNGSKMIIPSVKSHVLRKPKDGGSRANLYGSDWSSFQRRAESLLLGEQDKKSGGANGDGAIFDLTRINDKGKRNIDGGSQLETNMDILKQQAFFDEELEDIMKPPPPLESLSRMGRGMSHKKRKSVKNNKKNINKSLDQIKNVKVGRKGGTAAKIREMDVVKFICLRESLVARLKAVTRSLRTTALKLRMSRIKEGDALNTKMQSNLASEQKLFQELVSSLRKASVAVVESIQEWRKTIKMEESSRGESVYSTVTFEWQNINYLIKMSRDLIFLRAKKNVNMLNTSKFKSMTGKERVIELRKDDPRDTIALWCGLDPLTNPLLMLPPGHSIVQRLKEEKAVWEVELNQALHDEAEEIAAAYMKQRAAGKQKFGAGRGVLTVDDEHDTMKNEKNDQKISVQNNGENGEIGAEIFPFAEDSETDGNVDGMNQNEPREPWRWFALDLAPSEVSVIPAVDARIYDRVIEAHNVILNERNIEAQVQEARQKLLEFDDTYDAITSIADNGGVNNILQHVRDEPPAGKNAGEKLQSRQQQRNLRKIIPGMAKPDNPENIDSRELYAPAMKPKQSKMVERLNELMEDEGILHTAYDQENASILGSSLRRRSGMTESRRFVRWQARAARKIQARVRGMLTRKAGGRVHQLRVIRTEKRNKSATNIQKIARGMLGRLYVEEYRLANTKEMTDEEAAIKVQAGLRAMWARKYVDVIRTYEKTMKIMKTEEIKKEEARRKQERARMVGGLLTLDGTNDVSTGLYLNSSSNVNYNDESKGMNDGSIEETGAFSIIEESSPMNDGSNEDFFEEAFSGKMQEHVYSPDEFDQADAAVTIQAQVRGFVERKRGIVMESRKSENELSVPRELLEDENKEEKRKIEGQPQPRLVLSVES